MKIYQSHAIKCVWLGLQPIEQLYDRVGCSRFAGSPWVFRNDNGSTSNCANNCANNCGNNVRNNAVMRGAVFAARGSVVRADAEMCREILPTRRTKVCGNKTYFPCRLLVYQGGGRNLVYAAVTNPPVRIQNAGIDRTGNGRGNVISRTPGRLSLT